MGAALHRELVLTPPALTGGQRDPDAVDAARRPAGQRPARPRRRARRRVGPCVRRGCCGPVALPFGTSSASPPSSTLGAARAAFVAELALRCRAWSPTTARSSPSGLRPPPTTSGSSCPAPAVGRCWPGPGWPRPASAHLVGGTSPGGSGTVNALGPDALWPPARGLRRDVLDRWRTRARAWRPAARRWSEALRWRRPRRLPSTIDAVVAATLEEAEWLGVTGRGALSRAGRCPPGGQRPGRHRLDHAPASARRPSSTCCCRPTSPRSHPARSRARWPSSCGWPPTSSPAAAPPSTGSPPTPCGAASTPVGPSTRCSTALTDASHTPVPQPLDYLVRDVARRHGQARVGSVASYLRCDDEATLGAMLADRALGALQLRRIAPTVLVSPVAAPTALDFLRDGGYAPAAESADGGLLVPATGQHRTPPRAGRPSAPTVHTRRRRAGPDPRRRAARGRGVRGIPAGAARRPPRPRPAEHRPDHDARGAARRRRRPPGGLDRLLRRGRAASKRLLFYPDRVEGGRVHGTADGAQRTLSIHRVTGASAS